jgi:hypothetical protein
MVVVNHIPHPSNWDELKMAGFGILWQGMIRSAFVLLKDATCPDLPLLINQM